MIKIKLEKSNRKSNKNIILEIRKNLKLNKQKKAPLLFSGAKKTLEYFEFCRNSFH